MTPVSTDSRELAPPRRDRPEKMNPPRPGPREYAAIAAIPMTIWADTRMPVRMIGHAIGSSTCRSVRNRLMPMPRADSTIDGAIPDRPTTALRRMGSVAKNATTMTAGTTPKPSGAMSNPMNANDGIVKPMADTELATPVSAELR